MGMNDMMRRGKTGNSFWAGFDSIYSRGLPFSHYADWRTSRRREHGGWMDEWRGGMHAFGRRTLTLTWTCQGFNSSALDGWMESRVDITVLFFAFSVFSPLTSTSPSVL
jgi:hypothetical protein